MSLKYDKKNWYFHVDVYAYKTIPRTGLLRMRNISDRICRESQKTHFVSIPFFFKSYRLQIKWKIHVTDDNIEHAHCLLNTKYKKHTQNKQYLLLFQCNDGCAKASQGYVVRTRPVLYFSTHSSSFLDQSVTYSINRRVSQG